MARRGNEKTPLVARNRLTTYAAASTSASQSTCITTLEKSIHQTEGDGDKQVSLQRHITLLDCVGIIIGNVIGSGIFISPKGVLANLGSPGATLITWATMGLLALIQAMCYAELGTVIPKAGGDYVYIYSILGPLPGFICAWTHIMIVAASANAVIGRTAALYLGQALGITCHDSTTKAMSIWLIITFAVVNSFSSRLGTRLQGLFSLAKVLALGIIIAAGIWNLTQGYTYNFQPENAFVGTSTYPGLIAMGALDGYFAYKGWELVNTLPEEMVNPKKDLPRSIVIAMLTCTGIYVMTNVAYLTTLSPNDILSADAVALTFMQSTIGPAGTWFVTIAVVLSCMGTINGSFLSDSKYLFAAGRFRQMPQLFAMIQIDFLTPIACMVMLCVMSIIYSVIPNAESFQSYTSLAVQLKIMMSMVALLVLRWRAPDLHRPVKVPLPLVMVTLLTMLVLILLGLLTEPVTIGLGIGLFLMGIPIYFITRLLAKNACTNRVMDRITCFTQLFFQVILETSDQKDERLNMG